MDFGVRALKRRLSEYIVRAARGEVIRVTDRGEAKAMLGPPSQGPKLDAGVAEGWIRAGQKSTPRRAQRHKAGRRVANAVTEDRG